MKQERVDVAVIGGGIQGAGVVQAAAAAGYSVVLVEKNGLASATSSKSSKLIHGGLRYLQQGRVRMVREALKDRQVLLRVAPHLVRLNDFYIPIYRHSHYRPWQIRSGLLLYALLAGIRRDAVFSQVPRQAWSALAIETQGLQAVFRYSDGQTDDQLLTQAVARSAVLLGARLREHTCVLSAIADREGYVVHLGSGDVIHSRVVVNAAGPWVNQVADTIQPPPEQLDISLVQGSHLVLERQLSRQCFYVESPDDGRAIFILPWRNKTLLGTTERIFTGDPARVIVSEDEEDYLLRTLAHYFPAYVRGGVSVCERMAGVRVLPASTGATFAVSREMRLVQSWVGQAGYIGIYGGKLTGYRSQAAKVVALIKAHLGERVARADTATLSLT